MGTVSAWSIREMISKAVFMISVFLIATAARGEWLLCIVYVGQDYFKTFIESTDVSNVNTSVESRGLLDKMRLQDLHIYMFFAIFVSFSTFWGIGLSFDTYFYKNRKHVPETWKCQPDRWLSKSNEWHEFILGSTNMLIGSVGSGFISCYIMNGGHNTLYMRLDEYGYVYLFLSIPALFLYNEAISYYPHRFFHNPWLYKNVHKIHHRYGSPTLYSAVAMHPLEFIMYQTLLATPAFVVPMHAVIFVVILLYGYYFGMMDHSGIKMDSVWPWQPSSMFHDDHHRHFHCNFGFNTLFFDRFHGTLRRQHRKYGEKHFGGAGKAVMADDDQKQPDFYTY